MSRPAGIEEQGHVGSGQVGITGKGAAWVERAARADLRLLI